MRKFYLLMVALFALTLGANAQVIRTLYAWDDYKTGNWTGHGNITFSVTSDVEGSYYTLKNGGGGNRGAITTWGDVFDGITKYSLQMDYQIASLNAADPTRYQGLEISFISTSAGAIDPTKNAQLTENYVLDFFQPQGEGQTLDPINTFKVNGTETVANLPIGAWYTLYVDVDGSSVSYQVKEAGNPDGAALVKGTATVAEGVESKIAGLYVRMARGQGDASFSNLKITAEAEGDFANKPSVVMTSLWQNERYFQAKFGEFEILHIEYPDGTTKELDYWSAENENGDPGIHNFTVATSGTLKLWTTMNSATSDVVSIDVDATPITLVEPTYIINEVSEGYGKVYRLSIDNSQVTLAPQIFLRAIFTPDGAGTPFDMEVSNGGTIKVDGKGTVKVTANTILINEGEHTGTRAYNESSITIVNDVEYTQNKEKSINFAHLTDAVLTANGFAADGNASGNWANYGRLYGIDAATVGTEAPAKLVYNEIPQYTKLASVYDTQGDGATLPGFFCVGNAETNTESASPTVNMHVWQGVGLVAEGRRGDAMDGAWINNAYFLIEGLTENDYTATYGGGNYGNGGDKDSNHPAVASIDELKEKVKTEINLIENTCTIRSGIKPIGLYRISDAIGRIDVYSPKNGTGINEIFNADQKVISDHNAPIYNLNGVRVNGNALQKGIYIMNGKKFVVK